LPLAFEGGLHVQLADLQEPLPGALYRVTKILPSPIWPVRADCVIASMTLSTRPWSTATSKFNLRQEAHGIFRAAIDFRVPLLAAVALDLRDRQPVHARGLVSASADFLELEGLDELAGDELHASLLELATQRPRAGSDRKS